MRSTKVEFRWPWILHDAIEELRRKAGFKNMGRFLTALAIREAISEKRSSFLKSVAEADLDEQDAMLEFLLDPDFSNWRTFVLEYKKKNK